MSCTQKITPFEVVVNEDQINYDFVIREFGSTPIDSALIERFEKLTGQKAHLFLRRGLYFSHRDFEKILDLYEKGKPFYIFTGRGPSSGDMHIGHMVPFMFTAYIQRVFNCCLVIQINDDEKFFWKDVNLEKLNELARNNVKDVLSFGFDPKRTFIFLNTEYIRELYPNVCRIQKRVTFNQVKAIFGLNSSSSIGKIAFPAIQAAPSFSSSFKKLFGGRNLPCLILCAIDQDPYFRMTRDVAPKMNEVKPALLHCKFVPGLQGVNSKMSASTENGAIYLNDSPGQIKKKINASKSGGGETLELHKKHGANIAEDVPFAYLKFFFEDDVELERIEQEYRNGKMQTGEVKAILIETITPILQVLKEARESITEHMVAEYTTIRELKF